MKETTIATLWINLWINLSNKNVRPHTQGWKLCECETFNHTRKKGTRDVL